MTPASADIRLLEIDILGYWHPGTGKGGGPNADALVNAGPDGMPILPGRSVRGLLRAAIQSAVAAGMMPAEDEVRLFGTRLAGDTRLHADNRVRRLEEARFRTTGGQLRVESAVLGRDQALRTQWSKLGRAATRGQPDAAAAVSALKRSFSSTKLTDQGTASDATLRTIEVYVPMPLYATLNLPGATDRDWLVLDQAARLFLRGVGSHRHRGLGRCAARILPPHVQVEPPHAHA